jgi:hypothetical protein
MTDELGKIKDINSKAKKRLQQIQLVEKHGTDKQAFPESFPLVYSPCQRTVQPVVVLIESSKAFHFPFAFHGKLSGQS